MKITYLFNVRFPSERAHAAQVAHMCQAFAQCGHNVTLFTNKRGIGTLAAIKEVFGFVPEFSLKTLPPSRLYGETKAAFVWRELLFVFSFWWQYKKGSSEVIYSRSEWILYLLSFLLPYERFVFESHEAKYNRAVRRLVMRQVPIVAISEGIMEYYEQQGVPRTQMIVAHDGVDESFFEPIISKAEAREALDLHQDSFIAMYIGGFDEWKGVETFFKAAVLVPDVMFIAIGGQTAEVERYKVQYPQVRFLGPRPYRDLHLNQQAADVLVVPNTATNDLSARYTSPLKLFAHMASGVPIVASNIPSLTNVLGNELAALFTADDIKSLASAIMIVQNTYQKYQAQAKKLSIVCRGYAWKERAKAVTNFINLQFYERDNHST